MSIETGYRNEFLRVQYKNKLGVRNCMYYHVSSFIEENQILTHESKNNYCFCKKISEKDVLLYKDYISLINELVKENVEKITQRDHYKWSCEAIFESVRKKFYLDKPSRIWSIYVFDSIKNAQIFKNKYRGKNSSIFEIDVPINAYRFDMDLFTTADELLRKNNYKYNHYKSIQIAHKYWEGKIESNNMELLLDADKIIVGKKI